MDRRDFIKLTAITGTSASLASCGNPENVLIRFVPEEELVPGIATWKPSVCPLCRAGCGLQVRVMEGEADVVRNGQAGTMRMGLAKKLEGNPRHPVNRGKLCPRGQAAIQLTYHPDRIRQPLKRVGPRGTGEFQAVSWDEAIEELVAQLDALGDAKARSALAFLTRPRRGQRRELIRQFQTRFGAPPPLEYELFGEDVLRRANNLSFGREQLPTLDLARSRYVLGVGADFLGTWNSPVAQNIGYGEMRQGRSGIRGRFVQVESRMSPTGANCDEWVPVRPGTEGVFALGLAHVILKAGLRPHTGAGRAGTLIDGWAAGLPDYEPGRVERLTGIQASRIERLAREFAEHTPAVAVIGGAPLAQTNGLFHALAVNALNALAGSVEQPGGIFFMPQSGLARSASDPAPEAVDSPARTIQTLAANILAAGGSVDREPVRVLLLDDVNPVFGTPPGWRVRDALGTIPFIASFGSFIDDTSVLADLILPDHSFLESWVEGSPESGALTSATGVAAPVMHPLHQTRATPDVLLDVGRRLRRPLELPWRTFEEMLHDAVSARPATRSAGSSPAASSRDPWQVAQEQGGWWPEDTEPQAPGSHGPEAGRGIGRGTPAAVRFVDPQYDGDPNEYPFQFLPYASQGFLDGSLAHLPWLQEMPDVVSTAMWSSWVEVNPRTAERLQIGNGDLVEVRSRHGALEAPALVSPGVAPDIVAMPVGQGHQTFTRYASGRGANPIAILAPMAEAGTGAFAWAATRVRIARAGRGDGRLILFAGGMRERPHEAER